MTEVSMKNILRILALLLILATVVALQHIEARLEKDIAVAEARTAEASQRATKAQEAHKQWTTVRDRYTKGD